MSSMKFLRQVARSARTFSTTSVARKDLVQDLYVQELKAYKPPAPVKDAHVGAVKVFSLPAVPKPPTLPADLAAELTAYDATEPTKADVEVVSSSAHAGEDVGKGADAFLGFLEADVKQAEAHH
ncbi:ATP synthase complex subunit H-domain-containing protein [Suillus paluster]|uniref:ATP synthase complex subunit H-domain-containing protein n=1 Tax=Suillus paluster TaxID=48578 RepID=UPI001B85C664|nr:ATP synthase complex subunit H-domain-containing protein [Suillus paluster]KAG1749096.1 ATP synthase complex subunit H-domain-containing protein [Suillus paluster]